MSDTVGPSDDFGPSKCIPRFQPWPLIAFAAAIGAHLLVKYLSAPAVTQPAWADLSQPHTDWFAAYIKSQDYYLSFSYALAAAFTAYALSFWAANRRVAVAGGAAGISIAGILWGVGCFLTGCCGSPMLGVYASILGTRATWFGKPFTAAITLLSVLLGYVMIRRKGCEGGYCTGSKAD